MINSGVTGVPHILCLFLVLCSWEGATVDVTFYETAEFPLWIELFSLNFPAKLFMAVIRLFLQP